MRRSSTPTGMRWLCLALVSLPLAGAAPRLRAQAPSEQPGTLPTAPVPLPLSGRPAGVGTVSVTQQTSPSSGAGTSVNVIEPQVVVQPPWNGSVPDAPLDANAMHLTLEQALALGMKYNLGAVAQSAQVMQARGQRMVVRSQLLPTLNSAGSEVLSQINLREQGVETNMFPTASEYNYFDFRAAKLQQTVFDLVSVENLHSASASLRASLSAAKNARDLVVLAVGGAYFRVVAARARVEAAVAQVGTSTAIYHQARDRFAAGLAARVDATRAQVQLQTETLRLRSLEGDLATQKLALARIIGLATGQQFDVADAQQYVPLEGIGLDDALRRAQNERPDLDAAKASVRAAESAVKAAHAERLPNVKITADVGVAGLRPTTDVSAVYNVAGTITIPIYEGGKTHGDIEQADAALAQRRAELGDLRGQVDQDVRQAFINLGTAADQVAVAQSNVGLAEETLEQSSDRFIAGVADMVEVVQSQQAVVQADDDFITAIFEHNLAKVALARAMGHAEQLLPQWTKRP